MGTGASDHGSFTVPIEPPLTEQFSSRVSGGLFTKDSRYLLQETANTYDAHGRITQLTDARGNPTNYRYGGTNDAFLTRITRKIAGGSDSLVTELTYDDRGNLESITDEGGSTRSFTYDGLDRLREVRNDSNVVIRAYDYTAHGRHLDHQLTGRARVRRQAHEHLSADSILKPSPPPPRPPSSPPPVDKQLRLTLGCRWNPR